MPATRLAERRRRSSHAIFTPAKPGTYGVSSRPVTFAPNVTPVTFNEGDTEADSLAFLNLSTNPNVQALTAKLFPPSETPAPPPTRKRLPPGKRLSQGYIPRPPNAFMLFRADFVRQKHVPGSIETDHGSLSKIIGNCWRQLPLEEKRVWEVKAKQEKALHKAKYPDYRFRPVHNKKKNAYGIQSTSSTSELIDRSRDKQPISPEEERRCEEVAQLLLEGKKGEELARAVRDLDRARSLEKDFEFEDQMNSYSLDPRRPSLVQRLAIPIPTNSLHAPSPYGMQINNHRRSSSVPLPNEWLTFSNGFNMASIPPFTQLRASISMGMEDNSQIFEQFTNPFLNSNSSSHSPFLSHDNSSPNINASFSDSQLQPNSFLFAPQPQLASNFINFSPTFQNISRNSFGLGHRRASSAQPILRRSWTIPMPTSHHHQHDFSSFDFGGGLMEKDHNPLPEVNSDLFSNFSFGANSSSLHPGSGSMSAPATAGLGAIQMKVKIDETQVDPSAPFDSVTGHQFQHAHPHPHQHHHSSSSLSGLNIALSATSISLSSMPSVSTSNSNSTISSAEMDSPAVSVTDVLPEIGAMGVDVGNIGPHDTVAPDTNTHYAHDQSHIHSHSQSHTPAITLYNIHQNSSQLHAHGRYTEVAPSDGVVDLSAMYDQVAGAYDIPISNEPHSVQAGVVVDDLNLDMGMYAGYPELSVDSGMFGVHGYVTSKEQLQQHFPEEQQMNSIDMSGRTTVNAMDGVGIYYDNLAV